MDGQYTWKEAKADAEKRGGHLATFINDKEWESFLSIVGGKDNVPYGAWMGGTDEKTEGAWEWITNELWKFTNWRRGEPNNAGGNEDHLHVWHIKSNTDKKWNDQRTGKFPYILEYGYYTDPTLADSDGDRVNDGVEVAAKTDPNNPLSRPAPDRDAPGTPPTPPPGPDYVKKIEELTKDNAAKTDRIEDLETAEKAHLATIADLNATNVSLTATVEAQKKTIANLNAENASLKQQLGNSREEVVNVSYELTETKEQLQAAIDVARTPFVNGWVYDPQQGWLFTDADHYPLVYSHSTESWHYYELGTADPRFFYSYKTQEWEAWDPMPEQTETAVASSQSATANQNL
ncbi:MAG: lectin-like protein [Opitutales bacterium]